MKRNSQSTFCLFLALFFSSCHAALDNSDLQLVGGEEVPTDLFKASFYLRANCTATKIAKDIIITAAHCVISRAFKDIKPQFIASEQVPLTLATAKKVLREDTAQDIAVDIKDTKIFPDYWKACQDHCDGGESVAFTPPNPKDIAIIMVSLPNPAFEALPIASIAKQEIDAAKKVLITGYGCEQGSNLPDEMSANFKYKLIKPLTPSQIQTSKALDETVVSGLQKNFHMTPGLNWQHEDAKFGDQFASLCPGDSGGALYTSHDGKSFEVAGINSFMLPPENDANGISAINFHSRVDAISAPDVIRWIEQSIAAKSDSDALQTESSRRDREPAPEKECRYCRFILSLSGSMVKIDDKTGKSVPRDEWDISYTVHGALKKAGIRSWVYRNSVEISEHRQEISINTKLLPGGEFTKVLETKKNWMVAATDLEKIFANSGIAIKTTSSYVEILDRYKKKSPSADITKP